MFRVEVFANIVTYLTQIVSEVYLVSHLRGKKHQLALEEVQKGKKTDDNVSFYSSFCSHGLMRVVNHRSCFL